MQKANPIRRRFAGHWSIPMEGPPRPRHRWVAVCPQCSEEIRWRDTVWLTGRDTRKNTKDALYRHMQEQHKPGLVGR